MASIKRQPVCFNLENESQKELYELCKKKFGSNMSNGIRGVLFAYFSNSQSSQPVNTEIKVRQQESSWDLETVL